MRDTRTRFLFFGLLPAFNALGLFVYSIFLVTGGRGSTGLALIVVLLAMLILLVAVAHAGVRRARDLGWSGSTTFVVLALAALLVLPLPLLLAWFALAPGRAADPAPPAGLARWLTLLLLLALPWMLVLVARSVA
jgi:uncharacterized membrane protein YhaH (DUF805 family)